MNAQDAEALPFVQHVARRMLALRDPLPHIVEIIARSMRHHGLAPDEGRVATLLRRPSVQNLLATHYEVGLWRATDGDFRLVSLAINFNPQSAVRRLAHPPPNRQSCCFCLIDEGANASRELRPETDAFGNVVPGVYLHPACRRPWRQLRVLAERVEVAA